jgi:hypothetical protein
MLATIPRAEERGDIYIYKQNKKEEEQDEC